MTRRAFISHHDDGWSLNPTKAQAWLGLILAAAGVFTVAAGGVMASARIVVPPIARECVASDIKMLRDEQERIAENQKQITNDQKQLHGEIKTANEEQDRRLLAEMQLTRDQMVELQRTMNQLLVRLAAGKGGQDR